MKIGIQGGKGSFNEAALKEYVLKNELEDIEIVYLYTTEAVLNAVESSEVDQGVFAVFNTLGGLVEETANVVGAHKFRYIDTFKLQIRHFLMCKQGVDRSSIKTIYAHPQVLIQCAITLGEKYKGVELRSGNGESIDTARAAEMLAKGEFGSECAVLGNRAIAEIYGLDIVDENLQDREDNFTHFMLVGRA